MTDTISESAKERLLQLLRLMEKHPEAGGIGPVTSAQVEHLTGWHRDTIRKDISCLKDISGETGGGAIGGNSGYEPEILVPLIRKALGLDRRRKFCVVGLGRLGSAYLNFAPLDCMRRVHTPPHWGDIRGMNPRTSVRRQNTLPKQPYPDRTAAGLVDLIEFKLAAGFDTNVNRVEILSSPVPLFPAYKIAEVVGRFEIEIALLCVPAESAQAAAEKCVAAGIKGIMNFAPVALNVPPEVAVKNIYVTDELRSLAIKMNKTGSQYEKSV